MEPNERNNKGSATGIRMLVVLLMISLCGIAMILPVAAEGTTAAGASDAWSGTWDSQLSTTLASQTLGSLTLTRVGSSVRGTFSNADSTKGTISGTVTGNQLVGTWSADYLGGSDNGQFVFILSNDKNAFSGTWISAANPVDTIGTSSEFWNGGRV